MFHPRAWAALRANTMCGDRAPACRRSCSAVHPGEFVVDRTPYDTTSILATIERRFNLAPLTTRDARVRDLSSVYDAKSPFDDDSGSNGQR